MKARFFRSLRQSRVRTRRGWRPDGVQALEGRALLTTTSALDPTFGTRGLVLGTPLASPGTVVEQRNASSVTAIAVQQGDGRILTAEINAPTGSTAGGPTSAPLVIHRYLADGSPDTSFGTNGQTVVPVAVGDLVTTRAPHNLFVTDTGQILVTAEVQTPGPFGPTGTPGDVVARLTSTGALDTTFGTNGVVVLPSSVTGVNSVVVASGRVIVAGTIAGNGTTSPEVALVGLTDSGALDATYGTDGILAVPNASNSIAGDVGSAIGVTALRSTSTGQFLLGAIAVSTPRLANGSRPVVQDDFTLTRLNADGTIDTTFGTDGTADPFTTRSLNQADFVVRTNGQIIVAGSLNSGSYNEQPFLARLTDAGVVDSTFTAALPATTGSYAGFVAVAVGTDGAVATVGADGTVRRFLNTGAIDPAFGQIGRTKITIPTADAPATTTSTSFLTQAIAVTPEGKIEVGGGLLGNLIASGGINPNYQRSALAQVRLVPTSQILNDYDGDGRSDLAAELTQYGVFAYRRSDGLGDTPQNFGPSGVGLAIPAPGDYDGDGKADLAVYLPTLGILAYRPSTGGPDVSIRFGPTGAGNAVPAPGDYDGDGKTDVALYLPGPGTFIVMPSNGSPAYQTSYGAAGTGNSIAAPGDYDGDGKTDLAVYLPNLGILAYRPSSGTGGMTDVYVGFGAPGAGQTLIAPGDFDGDGKTDVAGYLPSLGLFVYRPSAGGQDVALRFGPTGAGNAVPTPGDYDGDGKTDVALFLPNSATYAIAPSNGRSPYAAPFGATGAGNTVPATVVVPLGTVSAMSLRSSLASGNASATALVYLTPDEMLVPPTGRRKPKA